jgi:hypothetical protein
MSGFVNSSSNVEVSPPAILSCDKLAAEAASDAAGFGFSEDAQARLFIGTYFTCLQDPNGQSVFEFLWF